MFPFSPWSEPVKPIPERKGLGSQRIRMTGAMGTWHEQGLPRAELLPLRTLRKATGDSGVSAGNAWSLSLRRIAGTVAHKFHPVKLRLLQRDGPPRVLPQMVYLGPSHWGSANFSFSLPSPPHFNPRYPFHFICLWSWSGKDIQCEAREFPAKADGLWDAFRTVLKHEKLRFKITLEDKGEKEHFLKFSEHWSLKR